MVTSRARGARSLIQSIRALKDFAKLYRDSNIKMNTSIILHKEAQKHKGLALLYWHQRIKTDVAEKGGIGDKCLACKAGVFWSGIHELFSGMTLSCHLGR